MEAVCARIYSRARSPRGAILDWTWRTERPVALTPSWRATPNPQRQQCGNQQPARNLDLDRFGQELGEHI
jgi:hypothetical protein